MPAYQTSKKVVINGINYPLYHYVGGSQYHESNPTIIVDNRNVANIQCAAGVPAPDSLLRAKCAIENYELNDRKCLIVPSSPYSMKDHNRLFYVHPDAIEFYGKQASLVFNMGDVIEGLYEADPYSFTLPVDVISDGEYVFNEKSLSSLNVPSICVEFIKNGEHFKFIIYEFSLMREFANAYNTKIAGNQRKKCFTKETPGMWVALDGVL